MADYEAGVLRHVRQVPEALDGDTLRVPTGQFAKVLPPLQKLEPAPNFLQRCAFCGRRRGLHRWGDEACINPAWKGGNGKPQFLEGLSFRRTP